MKRLSIIIPIHNVEKYVSRCLESVYAIHLPEAEYEVICVDDCSGDHSVKIIEEYQYLHDNLRILHHTVNKRQGGARNTGVQQAKGRYILFVDGDDSIPQYDLSGLLDYMDNKQIELLVCAANILRENGTVKRWGNAPLEESPIMAGPDFFTDEYVHKVAYGTVWLGIYRRDRVNSMRPFVENVPYEDADWTLQCAYESERIQYKPVVIYNYIQNPVSTTRLASISNVVARLRQSFRVWNWAQTVSINKNAVVTAVKSFCVFNLRILRSLWQYSVSDRRVLFRSFTGNEWRIMAGWLGKKHFIQSGIIKYPLICQCLWTLSSPFCRLAKIIKKVV